jgi:hypothetical protein
MRLQEYAIAISTSAVFAVTLPMPLFGWAIRHLKSNLPIAHKSGPKADSG